MNLYRSTTRAMLTLLVLAGGSAAAEIEPGLPSNTTAVLTINLKQLLHAPSVKQHGLASLRQAIQNTDAIRGALAAFGLDPTRDLDRLTIAQVSEGKKEASVVILRGRFDTARFHLAARQLVKQQSDRFAAHTEGALKYYGVISSGEHGSVVLGAGTSSKKGTLLSVETKGSLLDAFGGVCVALADKNTLIAASSAELLKGTCRRIAAKDGDSLNKPMRHLLAERDGKQTIVFAMRPARHTIETSKATGRDEAQEKDSGYPPLLSPLPHYRSGEAHGKDGGYLQVPPPPPLPEPPSSEAQPEESSKPSLRDLSGCIALADDFKLRCTLRTSSSGDAKEVMKSFDELRLRMSGLTTLLAGSSKKYAYLKEIPNSFLAVRKGRVILVEGHLSADTLAKLLGTPIRVKAR
jgi:hypothetical protein